MLRHLLLIFALSCSALGATVAAGVSTASTANASSYVSGSFTPAANDLLVAMVSATGTLEFATMTDSQSLGFVLVSTTRVATNVNTMYLFVAKTLAANSSMTVTFDCTGDAATGAIIQVALVSGMTRTGYAAVRQMGFQNNQASSGTPAPAFPASALTGNPTIGFVMNASNVASVTEPTGWTERDDTGYNSPTTGAEYVSRNSGFTGTTITWGSTSGTAFGDIIVELDTSAASGEDIDAVSHGSVAFSGATSMTWNHTVAGSNRLLIVQVAGVMNATTVSGVTYNGTAMTRLSIIRDGGGSELFCLTYGLIAPSTGTHAVLVSFSVTLTGEYVNGSSVSLTGIHQTYPYRVPYVLHSGTATSATITASCGNAVSGDYLIGMAHDHQTTIHPNGIQFPIYWSNGFDSGNSTSFGTGAIQASVRTTLIWTQTADVYSGSCVALRPTAETVSVPVMDNYGQTATAQSASSATLSNFVMGSGTNSLLLCGLSYFTGTGNNTVTGVTFNSNAMTKLDDNRIAYNSQIAGVEFYYAKAPASATANIVASFSGTIADFVMGCVSFFLVDQSSTFGTVAKASSSTAAAPSVTVTSQVGALVQDVLYGEGNSVGQGQIYPTGAQLWYERDATTPPNAAGLGQNKTGAASVTMNWTNQTTPYTMMGVGINFGSGAGASNCAACDLSWLNTPTDILGDNEIRYRIPAAD